VKILVCVDSEPHSKSALERAIFLGRSLPADVTALHVVDPWLKKFYNELYSQGRKAYLENVDECLQADANRLQEAFAVMCEAEGLVARFKIRHGEPEAEILDEVCQSGPDMLITGGKPSNAWGRFRSRNLPLRLRKKLTGRASLIFSST